MHHGSVGSGNSGGSGASGEKQFEQLVSKAAQGRLHTHAIGRQLRVHRGDWDKFVQRTQSDAAALTLPKAAWVLDPTANKRLKVTQEQQHHQTEKLVDVKHAIKQEAKRTHRSICGCPVLHPGSDIVFYWNLFMGIWDASYTSFMIPISIAFVTYPCPWNWLTILDMVGGFVFSVDIFMNFHTGFEIMGTARRDVVMDPWSVAKYYIWHDSFVTDVLCVIPTPLLLFVQLEHLQEGWIISQSGFLKVLLLLRLARLWRFFILVQVTGGMQVLYKLFSASFLFLLNLCLSFCMLINFVACLLVFSAEQVGLENSWMHDVDGASITHASMGRKYVAAIYFGMSTLAGAGYGDVTPHTTEEEFVCAVIMAGGLFFFGFLISTLTHFFSESSVEGRSASEFRKKIDGVEAWMRRRQLPKLLQTRIKAYHVEVLHPASENNDVQFFDELPTALRDDVVGHLTKEILQHSPIFGVLGKHERRHLSRRMVPRVLPKGHDLYKEGDKATSMFILAEGEMLMMRHNQDIQRISPPAFVGETVILANEWPHARYRETMCRAVTSCLLWELSMEHLQQTVNVYPHIMEELRISFLDHLKDVVDHMQENHPTRQLRLARLDSERLDAMRVFNSVDRAGSEAGDAAEDIYKSFSMGMHDIPEHMSAEDMISYTSDNMPAGSYIPSTAPSASEGSGTSTLPPYDLEHITIDPIELDTIPEQPESNPQERTSSDSSATSRRRHNLPKRPSGAGRLPSGMSETGGRDGPGSSVPNSVTSTGSGFGLIERLRQSLRRRRQSADALERPLLEGDEEGTEDGSLDGFTTPPPTPMVHHTMNRMSEQAYLDLMRTLRKEDSQNTHQP